MLPYPQILKITAFHIYYVLRWTFYVGRVRKTSNVKRKTSVLRLDLMEDGLHHESKAVFAVGQHVFAAGKGTPAVDASETHLCLVDADVGEVCLPDE